MRIEIRCTVRGRERRLVWNDGVVGGDQVLMDRVRRAMPAVPTDVPARFIESVERVVGDRVRVAYLDVTSKPGATSGTRAVTATTPPESDRPTSPAPRSRGAA